MHKRELEKLIEDWFADDDERIKFSERKQRAMDQVRAWGDEKNAEQLWAFVFAAYRRAVTYKQLSSLEFPIELILKCPEADPIERVIVLAIGDERFNHVLTGIQRCSVDSEEIWNRISSLRPNLETVVDAWILAQDAEEHSVQYEENYWAIAYVLDWDSPADEERLWEFILKTHHRDKSDEVVGMLAAGPLENLLSSAGAKYIDRIEQLAKDDEKFNYLLGGVWKLGCPDDVWERLLKARKETW